MQLVLSLISLVCFYSFSPGIMKRAFLMTTLCMAVSKALIGQRYGMSSPEFLSGEFYFPGLNFYIELARKES